MKVENKVCVIPDTTIDVGRKVYELKGTTINHFIISENTYTDNLGAYIKQLFPNASISVE